MFYKTYTESLLKGERGNIQRTLGKYLPYKLKKPKNNEVQTMSYAFEKHFTMHLKMNHGH